MAKSKIRLYFYNKIVISINTRKMTIFLLSILMMYPSKVLCLENSTAKYCKVLHDEYGIMKVHFSLSKDSPNQDVSKYFDTTTKELNYNLSENWTNLSSIKNNSRLKFPVVDQRWEIFPTNHDTEGPKFWKFVETRNKTTIFVSVLNKNEWLHLKLDKHVYSCKLTNWDNCSSKIHNDLSSFAKNYSTSLWKVHDYNYWYSETQSDYEVIYENTKNCFSIEKGCIKMYLATCTNCSIFLKVKPTSNLIEELKINLTGGGLWNSGRITLINFTSCFIISTKLESSTNNTDEWFWAFGQNFLISLNRTCEENIRYLNFSSREINKKKLTCKNVFNETINLTSMLIEEKQNINKIEEKLNIIKIEEEKPLEPYHNLLYLLLIAPCTLIIVLVIFAVCRFKYRNHQPHEYEYMQTLNTLHGSNWNPIKTADFKTYVHNLFDPKNENDRLQKQFSSLPSGYLKPADEGKRKENIEKNSFMKIYPYDENRVKLEGTSDYINASYVNAFGNPKEYIVTQNPLQSTTRDFFEMVWQEKVEYIVMVSGTNDEYFCYWPHQDKVVFYGEIEVLGNQTTTYEFYDHRTLLIRRFGESREVNMLRFFAWSGENLSSHVFVEFVNRLLKVPHTCAPVVFHCLTGIGRCATVLLCDIALRSSVLEGTINLYKIVRDLRESRLDMVPKLERYQLAHLIIYEVLTNAVTAIEVNTDLQARFSKKIIKIMWYGYLEKVQWLHEAINPYIPCMSYLKKNRYVHNKLLPVQHSRVILQNKQPDYIHAMFVEDFNQQKKLIVAQQPLPTTLSNFWVMILQNHVSKVISLNESDNFHPTFEHKIIKLEDITIQFVDQEDTPHYEKLELALLLSNQHERNITFFKIKNWSKNEYFPKSTDVMISIWVATRGHNKKDHSSTVVCCDDGISSSGLMVCFFYLVEKMLHMGQCDVPGAVRAVRRTHSKFINYEEFGFLCRCALAFYKDCYKKMFD